MSKISLGTVQFGIDYGINSINGKVDRKEIKKILIYAKSQNINLLDTAPMYGDSEKILGELKTPNFKIITKTRHFSNKVINDNDINLMCNDFNNSLKRLKTKNIYALLIHNANDLLKTGSQKIYDYLLYLKQEEKITKIGVSVYDDTQLDYIINNFDIDLVQAPLNILDKRMIDKNILSKLQKKNIEFHARSIFLQGLLLMKQNEIPEMFDRWNALWKIWHDWLQDNQITALEALVRYATSIPHVSKVFVGVESENQLKEIILASNGSLPELPKELFSDDIHLLNPSYWSKL